MKKNKQSVFSIIDNVYKDLPSNFTIFTQDNLSIPFNVDSKYIASDLSGGADSALLTYLVCNYIKSNNLDTKVHIISHTRHWYSAPWMSYHSDIVYQHLKNLFPNIIIAQGGTFIPQTIESSKMMVPTRWYNSIDIIHQVATHAVPSDYCNYYFVKNHVTTHYSARTTLPSVIDNREPDRRILDLNSLNLSNFVNMIDLFKFYHIKPFFGVAKDWVLMQYKNLDLLDLYHKTRSCTTTMQSNPHLLPIKSYNEYTYGMNIPPCKECWWCWERSWAEKEVFGKEIT